MPSYLGVGSGEQMWIRGVGFLAFRVEVLNLLVEPLHLSVQSISLLAVRGSCLHDVVRIALSRKSSDASVARDQLPAGVPQSSWPADPQVSRSRPSPRLRRYLTLRHSIRRMSLCIHPA